MGRGPRGSVVRIHGERRGAFGLGVRTRLRMEIKEMKCVSVRGEKVVYHVIVKKKRGDTQYLYTYGAPERPGSKVFGRGRSYRSICFKRKCLDQI